MYMFGDLLTALLIVLHVLSEIIGYTVSTLAGSEFI